MVEYLKTLPNVGEWRAKRLLDEMRVEEVIDAIENDMSPIVNMKIGLTPKRAEEMRNKWTEDKAMREVYFWLGKHGIEPSIGKKIVKQWGSTAVETLEKDPYALTEIHGIGFSTADEIAFKVLREVPPDKRTRACIRHILFEAMGAKGHLCMPYTKLLSEAVTLLQPRSVGKDYAKEVRNAVATDGFLVEKFRHDEGAEFVYLKWVWEKEREIASFLVEMNGRASPLEASQEDVDTAERDISAFMSKDVVLNTTQRDAIISAFRNKITVITGGGGTGKSTICHCICTMALMKKKSIALMAPTGKAAKVLGTKTAHEAATIHRALGMKPGQDCGKERLNEDLVVIDEFSMCGLDTVYALVKSIDDNCNLVIVGDHQQLPSVSPGNFLHDIITSGVANVIKLDRIYRQDEKSYITVVANNIAKGLNANIPPEADDIKRKDPPDPTMIAYLVCDILRRSMDEKGIPIGDMHVMASIYKGDGGVDSLNTSIQTMMASRNGNPASVNVDGKRFFIGDKAMQIENNYEKNVFNGDVGFVVDAGCKALEEGSTVKETFVVVKFDDEEVLYKGADFDELKLAWCTTVHKFQGSQCKYVIFVAPRAHTFMLSKELVYTAVTRAEKKVIVMAEQHVLDGVPRRVSSGSRYTGLVRRIAGMRSLPPDCGIISQENTDASGKDTKSGCDEPV
jgi:exodeoxyribonuclease V alpha subunit